MKRAALVLLLSIASVVAVAAAASSAKANGAERIPMTCSAEWNPVQGWTSIYVYAPDSPGVPFGISFELPFTVAAGWGTFTPSGRMNVTCTSDGPPAGIPPWSSQWNGAGSCGSLRGGNPETADGAATYRGTGRVNVTPPGKVVITCEGVFAGFFHFP
jgi:hypothetical protein